jgi:hypothetical protein
MNKKEDEALLKIIDRLFMSLCLTVKAKMIEKKIEKKRRRAAAVDMARGAEIM